MPNKKQFNAKTNPNDIPADAFTFKNAPSPTGLVIFADEGGKPKGTMRLELYDGGIHYHYYWGHLAFDLEGMSLARETVPILYRHDHDEPIGVSTAVSFDKKFVLDGRFLKNSAKGNEVQAHSADGLQYESSLCFDSTKAKIEFIREGQTAKVNGQTLEGPGAIIRECAIKEGSICLFGALDNCRSEVFENINNVQNLKEQAMSEITIESFKAEHKDIFDKIFAQGETAGLAAGEKNGRDLFTKIVGLCDGDNDLAVDCFTKSLSDVAVVQAKNAKLAAANEILTTANADMAKQKGGGGDQLAESEFSDNAGDEANQGKSTKAEADQTADELKATFAASTDLQEEFGTEGVDAYMAYVQAEKENLVVEHKDQKS